LNIRFQKFSIALLLLIYLSISSNFGYGLEVNSKAAKTTSIDEIAQQIRQYKNWQILDASPRKKKSGISYFRFKLLKNDGTVKIINIDPTQPNLRRLE